MSAAEEYDDVVKISKVSVDTEAFTPDYTVHSVSLGYTVDDEENVVSIQRSFDEEDGVCLVLSPSQQCVYDEFTTLVLGRESLGVRFTPRAKRYSALARYGSTSRSMMRSGAICETCSLPFARERRFLAWRLPDNWPLQADERIGRFAPSCVRR
jgi:hypothetical protein